MLCPEAPLPVGVSLRACPQDCQLPIIAVQTNCICWNLEPEACALAAAGAQIQISMLEH